MGTPKRDERTLLFLLVIDCCHRVLFFTKYCYLTCVMACLMKNQRGFHYPEITANFFFELDD